MEMSKWCTIGEKVREMTMGWVSGVGWRSRPSMEVRSLQN